VRFDTADAKDAFGTTVRVNDVFRTTVRADESSASSSTGEEAEASGSGASCVSDDDVDELYTGCFPLSGVAGTFRRPPTKR
jgi:hypothetical protein